MPDATPECGVPETASHRALARESPLRREPGGLTDILLVEDNPADVRLLLEAFAETGTRANFHVASDGEAALAFLHGGGVYQHAARPRLIILDLNLPRKDGRQVLKEIKNDPDLRRIPVVIMTTSSSEDDVRVCYESHANCYIRKPLNLDEFYLVVGRIEEFWLDTVTLPYS